jgi:transcriptional regulator with XRE-family HTH domain
MKTFRFEKIKELRESQGLSLQVLATLMNAKHRQQVSQWELGVITPSTHVLCRISAALGVDPSYFFS